MKNKGFSLVELIIVIAIMAILAAALAPALVKYIAKARINTDVDTAGKLADCMVVALTDEDARDAAEVDAPKPVSQMGGDEYKEAVLDLIGVNEIKGKSKKDKDGNILENGNPQFYYTLDTTKNVITIYYGGTTDDYQMYPFVGEKFTYENKN